MSSRTDDPSRPTPDDVLAVLAAIRPAVGIDDVWDPREQAVARDRITATADHGVRPGRARRRGRTGRSIAVRTGAVAVLAAAAAVGGVLVVGRSDTSPPTVDVPAPAGVTLVDFSVPAYPLTLPTPPAGASGPTFGASGGDGGTVMSYAATDDPLDNLGIGVGSAPVNQDGSGPLGGNGWTPEEVTVDGVPAVFVSSPPDEGPRVAALEWERAPGQWVVVQAQGRYAERDVVLGVAADLVDGPQAIPVQLRLAPAGYSLDFVKDDGRIVRLGDDGDPESGLTVTRLDPAGVVPVEQLPGVLGAQVGGTEDVVVQGSPARLVGIDLGNLTGWVLEAPLPDGGAFVVEAPGDLTADQVVQIADQVSYAP